MGKKLEYDDIRTTYYVDKIVCHVTTKAGTYTEGHFSYPRSSERDSDDTKIKKEFYRDVNRNKKIK